MKLVRVKEFFMTQIKIILGHKFGIFGAVIIFFFYISALFNALS